MGNVIQIVMLIIAAAVGWATFDARISANETAIREGTMQRAAYEVRLRTVETNYARTDERLSSILSLLGRIDARLERIEGDRP